MKTALCFFGEPRSIDLSWPLIKANLVDPNGITDIFVHAWHSPENVGKLYNTTVNADGTYIVPNLFVREETPSLIQSLYRPKSCRIDHHIDWTEEAKRYHRPDFACKDVIPATLSMLRSVSLSYELMQSYEMQNDIRYDNVICIRPDIILKEVIDLTKLDLSKFNGINECCHPGGISYWMGIGNREVMGAYKMLAFAKYDWFIKSGIKFIPEVLVGTWMKEAMGIQLAPVIRSYGVLR